MSPRGVPAGDGKGVHARLDMQTNAQLEAFAALRGVAVGLVVGEAITEYMKRRVEDGTLEEAARARRQKIEEEKTKELEALDGMLAGIGATPSKKEEGGKK